LIDVIAYLVRLLSQYRERRDDPSGGWGGVVAASQKRMPKRRYPR
jgi:hypothetical protein